MDYIGMLASLVNAGIGIANSAGQQGEADRQYQLEQDKLKTQDLQNKAQMAQQYKQSEEQLLQAQKFRDSASESASQQRSTDYSNQLAQNAIQMGQDRQSRMSNLVNVLNQSMSR